MKPLKEIKDVVCCVVDRGTFSPIAQRLARDYAKVYYHIPDGEDFRTFAKSSRGDGQKNIQLIDDSFWKIKDEIDVFIFPDSGMAGLQYELESQGFPVWGSKDAYLEEEMRGRWIETCRKLGLPMPKTHEVKGTTNLLHFFEEHEGETFHVKISRHRGDMETFCAKEIHAIRNKIDLLSIKFGPMKEEKIFYVQEPVETDIEGGADTYFCGGDYPDKVVLGYEKKGESYFATWQNRSQIAREIWKPSETMRPLLAENHYCNLVSTEIRVKDKDSFLLDPCYRFPSPAGEEQLELYGNLPEIIYHGARGELVQPEMTGKFCGEAIIAYSGDRDGWKSIVVPEEVEQWTKLYANLYYDGAYHFPPDQDPEAIGCLVAIGDTPEEVLDKLKEYRDALKNSAVDVFVEPLADLFKEIVEAEDAGIPFSPQPIPEPADVLGD